MKCFPATGWPQPIFENSEIPGISPLMLDARLVTGWRHFGARFFRCNFAIHDGVLCGIVPLRLRLEDFLPTASQRRIERKNADTQVRIAPTVITPELHALFERHKTRFTSGVPDSLHVFLSTDPGTVPCENHMIEVRRDGRLLAASFLDIGERSVSSVYAMFEPEESARSLGIFTILCEIEHARRLGRLLYYLGYSYTVPSPYDYKLKFRGLEAYDWNYRWMPIHERFDWSRPLEE